MKLWQLTSLGLLLPLLGIGGGTQGALTKAQKDALLSRKKWYVTYDFSRTGSGEGWKVNEHSAGMIELNAAVPGLFPPSSVPKDPVGPGGIPTFNPLGEPGRFIGWWAVPDEKTQAQAGQGQIDPAKMLGIFFPYTRDTNDTYGDSGNSDTFRGAGTGYVAGACQLLFDLKQETFDLVFQVEPSDFGSKVIHEWHHKDDSGTEDWASPGSLSGWFPKEWEPKLAKRKFSQDMKQDGTISFSLTEDVETDVWAHGRHSVLSSVCFRISPSPPSSAKLYIEPADSAKYQKWRPRPGRTEDDPGTAIDVKYTVEEPGLPAGQLPQVQKITLRLAKVSKFPGVCMNWPLAPSGPPKFDLKFKPMTDTATAAYTLGQDDQSIRITGMGDKGAPITNTLTIQCFDGAAIGDIVAEAEMKDGRILTAVVRGQPSSPKLLIPDREDGVSDIAKYWKDKYASGQSDNEDQEGDPEGDGQVGDGLTLWEEYRGLRQGNVWRDNCEPKKKDLFIDNRVRAQAKAGIALFKQATGLAVHDALEQGEHQQNRVINFNSRSDRHVVDQHCLVLRISADPNAGTAQEQFGAKFPGPPKNTLWVNVVLGLPADQVFRTATPGLLASGNEDSAMIAHELGHAIGMYHHGDKDQWTNGIFGVIWQRAPNTSGIQLLENGSPIRVVDEPSGAPVDPKVFLPEGATQFRAYLGLPYGQHGGDYHCIMRYHVASFYVSAGASNVRVWSEGGETPGTKFCESPDPSEFNLDSNKPNSRFRSADTSKLRGNCVHQFVISDRWEKKDRR